LAQNLLAATTRGNKDWWRSSSKLPCAPPCSAWDGFSSTSSETGLEGKPLELPSTGTHRFLLNIKPETFSRALKSSENQGF
jgi:hypothetical protein